MSIWKKFEGKKEEKKSEDDITPQELLKRYNEGEDVVSNVGRERCFMCIMMGTNNPPTWRFIDKVYCDEHKPMMDSMLRAKMPGKEPPWERI